MSAEENQQLLGASHHHPQGYGNLPDRPQDLAANINRDQALNENGCCKTYGIAYIFHTIFYFLCSLTGQLTINFHNRWWLAQNVVLCIVWSSLWLVAFVLLNLGSLVFDVYVIAVCPFRNCSYIYTFLHNVTKWQTVVSPNHMQNLGIQPEQEPEYEDWQKTVITTASISGLLSYYFMVLVLIPQYSCLQRQCNKACDFYTRLWKWCGEKKHKSSASAGRILSPFKDSDEDEHTVKATHLSARQTFYFYAIFWLNLVLYISNVVVFYIILKTEIGSHDYLLRGIDIAGLTAQFSSQFCAILSCFIFSKVAYAVTNECLGMSDTFTTADVRIGSDEGNNLSDHYLEGICFQMPGVDLQPQASANSGTDRNLCSVENRHRAYVNILQKMDKQYTDMVKASLDPFGTWFAFHWVLYTLTAFMSIAYFAETVTQELYGDLCHHEHTVICRLDLAYILLFTLEHCILFLYPCFRAASVTAARDILIKNVSEASWTYIPHTVKDSFIKYLENHKSGFKVSILCAQIQFGYNIAYLSIFVGIFGVILKLSF